MTFRLVNRRRLTLVLVTIVVPTLLSCSRSGDQPLKSAMPEMAKSRDSKQVLVELWPSQQRKVDEAIEAIIVEVLPPDKKFAPGKAPDEACLESCKAELRKKVVLAHKIFHSPGSVYYHDKTIMNQAVDTAREAFAASVEKCQ